MTHQNMIMSSDIYESYNNCCEFNAELLNVNYCLQQQHEYLYQQHEYLYQQYTQLENDSQQQYMSLHQQYTQLYEKYKCLEYSKRMLRDENRVLVEQLKSSNNKLFKLDNPETIANNSECEMPIIESDESKTNIVPVKSEADVILVKPEADDISVKSEADVIPVKSEADIAPVKSEADVVPVKSEADVVPVKSEADVVPIKSEADIVLVKQKAEIILVKQKADVVSVKSEADVISVKPETIAMVTKPEKNTSIMKQFQKPSEKTHKPRSSYTLEPVKMQFDYRTQRELVNAIVELNKCGLPCFNILSTFELDDFSACQKIELLFKQMGVMIPVDYLYLNDEPNRINIQINVLIKGTSDNQIKKKTTIDCHSLLNESQTDYFNRLYDVIVNKIKKYIDCHFAISLPSKHIRNINPELIRKNMITDVVTCFVHDELKNKTHKCSIYINQTHIVDGIDRTPEKSKIKASTKLLDKIENLYTIAYNNYTNNSSIYSCLIAINNTQINM